MSSLTEDTQQRQTLKFNAGDGYEYTVSSGPTEEAGRGWFSIWKYKGIAAPEDLHKLLVGGIPSPGVAYKFAEMFTRLGDILKQNSEDAREGSQPWGEQQAQVDWLETRFYEEDYGDHPW